MFVVPEVVQLPKGALAVPVAVKLVLFVLKTFREAAVSPLLEANVEGSSIAFVDIAAVEDTKTLHFPLDMLFPSLNAAAEHPPELSLIGRDVKEVLAASERT